MFRNRLGAALCLVLLFGCDFRRKQVNEQASAADARNAKDAPSPDLTPSTRLSAAHMLETEGNASAAIDQYRRVLDSDPRNVEALTRIGILYDRMRQYDQAVRSFLRAIEIEPARASLHNNLGFSYMLQGQLTEAERAFRAALSLKPNYARARMNLGAVLAQLEKPVDAIHEFEQIVSRDAAYYNLGLILAAQHHESAAENAFRESLALNPGFRDARLELDRLVAARTGRAPGTGADPLIASIRPTGQSAPPAALPVPASQPAVGPAALDDSRDTMTRKP